MNKSDQLVKGQNTKMTLQARPWKGKTSNGRWEVELIQRDLIRQITEEQKGAAGEGCPKQM